MPGFRPVIKDNPALYTEDDWKSTANFLRKTPYEQFVNAFPHSRKDERDDCKAICTTGAEPALVYKLFCLGLLHCIYPGEDLSEIKHFPKNFQHAVKNFVEKTKSKKPLYLQIHGIIPYWDIDGNYCTPFQLIRIGTINDSPVLTRSEPLVEDAAADKYRDDAILEHFAELKKIEKMKFKINYATKQILIYSLFKKEPTAPEQKKIADWKANLTSYYKSVDETLDEPAPMVVEESTSSGPYHDVFPTLGKEAPREEKRDGKQVAFADTPSGPSADAPSK